MRKGEGATKVLNRASFHYYELAGEQTTSKRGPVTDLQLSLYNKKVFLEVQTKKQVNSSSLPEA